MNLKKKKELAARTLGVGKSRISFVKSRLEEIKEAITKGDILDLKKDGAIMIRAIKGRKKVVRRKRKRGLGKVRKKIKTRKKDYVILTRKLRTYAAELKKQGILTNEEYWNIRKKIRNKMFRSKSHLIEQIKEMKR